MELDVEFAASGAVIPRAYRPSSCRPPAAFHRTGERSRSDRFLHGEAFEDDAQAVDLLDSARVRRATTCRDCAG